MVWLELGLALVAIGAAIAAARQIGAHERDIEKHAGRLRVAAARLVEARYLLDLQRRIADAQQLAEAAIDTGAATVRAVHLGISRIPFGILESIPVTRDTTRIVRQTHDLISEAVYGSIRGMNKAAGHVTRTALGVQPRSVTAVTPPAPGPVAPQAPADAPRKR